MARPYRLQGENVLYHILNRGDDRKKIFISETDYQKFLEYLIQAKEKFKVYLYAYCLMSNHYHLLLETTQPNISQVMQISTPHIRPTTIESGNAVGICFRAGINHWW